MTIRTNRERRTAAGQDPVNAGGLHRLDRRESPCHLRLAPPPGSAHGGGERPGKRRSGGMTALLEAKNLSKHFGGLKAVDDLSLAVQEGELHCLIGPNGAGKSTLFRLILGRYPPTAGMVLFRGQDSTKLHAAARIRRGMSVKMQVPGVFPELSVRQNLIIALQNRFAGPELSREVDRLLTLIDLTAEAAKQAGQLAHGQKH